MQANMVFTVELEFISLLKGLKDDLVIQESGEPFNLMRNIPIEDEIESLMN
jgi:Xaa-Pro aminopeptidase